MFKSFTLALVLFTASSQTLAGDQTAKVAVGGGVGGALGAVIGEEIGDRNGAIVGSAIGAAVGTAIATKDNNNHVKAPIPVVVAVDLDAGQAHHPRGHHCPPGQAKKGRC